jgi:DtxR family Mn-dependent transcriptional regulator
LVRSMDATLSSTMEDYLEAIHDLERRDTRARVKDIAGALQVKMPSVSSALKKLKASNLIRHEKYGDVQLTADGRRVAEQIHRRHVTLTTFLTEILQLSPEEAEEEACQLEHGLSRKTLHRLICLLDFIERCPRSGEDWLEHMRSRWEGLGCGAHCASCIAGIQIPDTDPYAVDADAEDVTTLNLEAPGFRGRIVKVTGRGKIRRRLAEMGLTAGAEVEVERLAPLGDPMEIKIRGYHLSLRKAEAAHIYVQPK